MKQYKDTAYDIYEDGRCYSHKSNKFLTPQMTNKYPTYNLTIDGRKKKIPVHRMVAETFLPLIENKNIVNHKDGNTHNFCLDNLEWVTIQENNQHAADLGLRPKSNQHAIYYKNDLMNETWVETYGYKNYLISSCGRIINKSTKRLLKQSISNHGYYYVNLWEHGKGHTELIHTLMYKSFYNNYNNSLVINHIDGNKLNNNLNNLEQICRSENNLHAVNVIKTHKQAKKVAQISIETDEIIAIFNSMGQATKTTKINNISRAIKNKTTAGGYKWRIIND